MKDKLEEIGISSLSISEFNLRKRFPERNIEFLKKSIKNVGIQVPLVVRPKNGQYEIVMGQRRYLAIKELISEGVNIVKIPAIIREMSDEQANDLSLLDDCLHEMADTRDKGEATKRALLFKGTMEEVEKVVGLDKALLEVFIGTLSLNKSPSEADQKEALAKKPSPKVEHKVLTEEPKVPLTLEEAAAIEERKLELPTADEKKLREEVQKKFENTIELPWKIRLEREVVEALYIYGNEQKNIFMRDAIDLFISDQLKKALKEKHYLV